MTLDTLIIGAGAFVALVPFLGFPNDWDTALFLLAGIFVVGLGIVARRKRGAEETLARLSAQAGKRAATFTESLPGEGAPLPRHEEKGLEAE
jgi:hypothetical protein